MPFFFKRASHHFKPQEFRNQNTILYLPQYGLQYGALTYRIGITDLSFLPENIKKV